MMTSQVWSISTGDLVQSMRGHSGAVTGVQFLDRDTAARLGSADTEEEVRLVSAGSDCSVRVWGVAGGACLRSIYTYNGVTRLGLVPDLCASLTATDGGKLGESSYFVSFNPDSDSSTDRNVLTGAGRVSVIGVCSQLGHISSESAE